MATIVQTSNTKTHSHEIKFQATWEPEMAHLKVTPWQKIAQVIYEVISLIIFPIGILRYIIRSAVLPSSNWFFKKYAMPSPADINDQFEENWKDHPHYDHSPITFTTPDGIILKGTYFKKKDASQNADTVIFFNPNASVSKLSFLNDSRNSGSFIRAAAENNLDCNFVCFDYRGTGESEGSITDEKDLVIDGETVYQFVKNELNVPEDRIHFYGWSLGGGIAAKVKANHPKSLGTYVSDRSFTSLSECASYLIHWILSGLAKVLIKQFNWEMDTANSWEKMKGKKLVIYHPEDHLMKNVNLDKVAKNNQDRTINLNEYANFSSGNHTYPLTGFKKRLPTEILNYILN